MKAQEITVEVNAKLTVDKKTADICLRLAEMYCNENGLKITSKRTETGEMELRYEPT